MFELQGGWLDARHCIAPLVDSDGNTIWHLITFYQDIDPYADINNLATKSDGGHFFDMEEINPNDFEWNGRRVYIKY